MVSNTQQFYTKSITTILLFSFIFGSFLTIPQHSYASEVPEGFVSESEPVNPNQAPAAQFGLDPERQQEEQDGSLSDLAGSAASCSLGQILSQGLSTMIANALNSLTSEIASSQVAGIFKVPVKDSVQQQNQRQERVKEVASLSIFGIPILPSLDAIAWCLVNSIIEYIGHATVEWANSGFEGNPAFVDNPAGFFQTLGDVEAQRFIKGLEDQARGGGICEPYLPVVQQQLARRHLETHQSQTQCSIPSDVIERARRGEPLEFSEWVGLTRPENTISGVLNVAGKELVKRVRGAKKEQGMQLQWNSGFLSLKDRETGRVTTPGIMIEKRLHERLGLSERRLAVADEFDEIINALINNLIKLAMNKLLESAQ